MIPYARNLINRSHGIEIAAPEKIVATNWEHAKVYTYRQQPFYVHQCQDSYFLTDTPSMFDVPDNSQLRTWLYSNWNKLALITCQASNTFPERTIKHGVSLKELLDNKCFTVFNGLTLLLARHRLGLLKSKDIYLILCDFVATFGTQPFQDVPEHWHTLYYNRNVPNIADFPWYYLCMGPNWAATNVIELFSDINLNRFLLHTFYNFHVYSSAQSVMYPHFNMSIYKMTREFDASAPYDTRCIPDLEGFCRAITRNKRGIKHFPNGIELEFVHQYKHDYEFICHFLKAIVQTYNHQPSTRVRKLFGSTFKDKYIKYVFVMILMDYTIPIPILKDILRCVNVFDTLDNPGIDITSFNRGTELLYSLYAKKRIIDVIRDKKLDTVTKQLEKTIMFKLCAIYRVSKHSPALRHVLVMYLYNNKDVIGSQAL